MPVPLVTAFTVVKLSNGRLEMAALCPAGTSLPLRLKKRRGSPRLLTDSAVFVPTLVASVQPLGVVSPAPSRS